MWVMGKQLPSGGGGGGGELYASDFLQSVLFANTFDILHAVKLCQLDEFWFLVVVNPRVLYQDQGVSKKVRI